MWVLLAVGNLDFKLRGASLRLEGEWIGFEAQGRQQELYEVESVSAELSVQVDPGTSYRVEFSPALGSEARWTQLAMPPETPGRVTHHSAGAAMFYRLLAEAGSDGADGTLELLARPHLRLSALETYISVPGFPGWEVRFEMQPPDGPADQWVELPVFQTDPRGNVHVSNQAPKGARFRFWVRAPFDRGAVDTYVICGQSNGVVFDPRTAPLEPGVLQATLDGHLLPVSQYDPANQKVYQYPFAFQAAKTLFATTGRTNFVCGAAVGSTKIQDWMPGPDRFDAATLYGRANRMRAIWAPAGARAVLYYGHESNTDIPAYLEAYAEEWRALMAEFKRDFGSAPIIYAQFGKSTSDFVARNLHRGAAIQGTLETAGGGGVPQQPMVVTFDLPLADYIHLSPEGQRLLGQRFALAIRQHVFGHKVDGTGPRLVEARRVAQSGRLVLVRFSQVIQDSTNNYDEQFRVFSGGVEIGVARAVRGGQGDFVELTLEHEVSGPLEVSYGDRTSPGLQVRLQQVVRNLQALPAPQFGLTAVLAP